MPETTAHTTNSAIELLLRHQRFVWWLCLRHALGEVAYGGDLAQDVFVVLSRCTPKLPPNANPKMERAWLRTAVRNILANKSRHQVLKTEPLTQEHDRADDDAARQQRELVDELATHLDADDRQLLELYLEGFSPTDIAVILDLKDVTVRHRLQRLVPKMRTIYEKLYNTHIQ